MSRVDDSGAVDIVGMVKVMMYAMVAFALLAIIGIFSGTFMIMMTFIVIIFIVILLIVIVVRQPSGAKWGLLIGSFVMILVIVLAFIGFLPFAVGDPPGFNTSGWYNDGVFEYNFGGAKNRFVFSGSFEGSPLDGTAYATPLKSGSPGSTIYIEFKSCIDTNLAVFEDTIKNAQLHVFFTQASVSWGEPTYIDLGHDIEIPTCDKGWGAVGTVKTVEAVKAGWLKVDLHVQFYNGDARYYAASDYAYIHNGESDITKPVSGYVAVVGKPIDIEFKLGWACSTSKTNDDERTEAEGGGWTAAIYSEAQGKEKVAEWDFGCGGQKTPDYRQVQYTPTSADFDNEGGCKQKLYIELYNNLFMSAQKIVYTLDVNRAIKLPTPTLKVSSKSIVVGESVKATVNTTLTDVNFLWQARYVGGTVFLYENTTSNTFEVTPDHKGDVEITVNCHKPSDCSISDPVSVIVNVRDPGDPPPLLGGMSLLGVILVIIIIVVLVAITAFLPAPVWARALLIVVEVLLTLVAAYFLGVFG